jgi:hydroxymethylpyrimidine/phosphomethylpyrimidine kinase
MTQRTLTAMTIAGSDSGAGAGLQADLKTFSALGVFGTTAVTAVTVQNTLGVTGVEVMKPEFVVAQIEAILDDIGADAVKTGMLANAAIVAAVADTAKRRDLTRLVVDPVMIATSRDRLLTDEAIDTYRKALIPRALILTPNHDEAEILVDRSLDSDAAVRDGASAIVDMGARWVVMKGGHRPGDEVVDVLHDGRDFWEYRHPRIDTTSTHGTGCTLASAITARLAHGDSVPDAVQAATDYVHGAIVRAPAIGRGHGPLNHFWRWY